ncbi:MAG: hypothetical protein HRU20_16365 [Pseudomonadales bacterium]|nr:hypothetical protein [Pseudomonadales bacterium]
MKNKKLVAGIFVLLMIAVVGVQLLQKQRIYNERMQAANVRLLEAQAKIDQRYIEVKAQLDQVKNKNKLSKHDLWLIQHLEKTVRHLEKAKKRAPPAERPWMTLQQMEHGVMLLILLLGALCYGIKNRQSHSEAPADPGFASKLHRVSPETDPVADKTHWQVMRGGGANFKTHTLIHTSPHQLLITSSSQMKIFYLVFIAAGINNVVFNLIKYVQLKGLDFALQNPLALFEQFFTVGLMFVIVGMAIRYFFAADRFCFDKNTQQLDTGNQLIQLGSLHALQVLEETVGGSDSQVFKSYELNLVLKDGQRLHLMDHGHYSAFNHDAEKLADFLAIPIWQPNV